MFLENERSFLPIAHLCQLCPQEAVWFEYYYHDPDPTSFNFQPQSPVVRKQYKKIKQSCTISEKENVKTKETQTFQLTYFKIMIKREFKTHATTVLFVYSLTLPFFFTSVDGTGFKIYKKK